MSDFVPESGDIIWVEINPQSGHEQKSHRPALVLSPKIYNEKAGLCVCVPLTTQIKGYPFEIICKIKNKDGAILSDQIKSIDFRARKAKFYTKLDSKTLEKVKENIARLLNL